MSNNPFKIGNAYILHKDGSYRRTKFDDEGAHYIETQMQADELFRRMKEIKVRLHK